MFNTEYDFGNINWAYGIYNAEKTQHEYLSKIKEKYPDANLRDFAIMWQSFDLVHDVREVKDTLEDVAG